MRQRDEERATVSARASDRLGERGSSPEAVDSERADEQDDGGTEDRDLAFQPRRAKRDLRWRGSAVPHSARGLSREALRDRGAIGQLVLADARFGQPSPQLRARASAEWETGAELDDARRLPDDRDTVADAAGDDRLRRREVAGGNALRARADLAVQASQSLHVIDGRLVLGTERGVA